MLSKFENHFSGKTVRFQVQLGADGYFSAQKFLSLQTTASSAKWNEPAESETIIARKHLKMKTCQWTVFSKLRYTFKQAAANAGME